MKLVDDILHYWFGHIEKTGFPTENRNHIWFSGTPDIDQEIKQRFGKVLENAIAGELEDWKETPRSLLALIIVLDQFSRNVYRDTPKAFEQDKMALDLCLYAIKKEFDHEVSLIERVFIYMPLMHAEDLEMQNSSIHAFKSLSDLSFAETREVFIQFLDFAIKHYDVIKEFGRFPQRNLILNRLSTEEENAFLKKHGRDW